MDGWQKLEVASKVIAAVLVPLAIALGRQSDLCSEQAKGLRERVCGACYRHP